MSEQSPLLEAQQSFVNAVPLRSMKSENCKLENALGRTLASDLTAPTDMPPYHRAIVEGFVVNTADTQSASEEAPVSFSIKGEVKPGDTCCPAIEPGCGLRVSTGSILPDGPYSTVRMWEVNIDGDNFSVSRPFPPRFFIEDKGCDLAEDAVAIPAGTQLSPLDIGTIASMGIDTVEVSCKPIVSIFSSGDEVIPYTDPMTPGAIRDSNSLMLAAAVSEAGAIPKIVGIMQDDFDKFVSAVKQALENSDMILISGGTAIGDRDFISDLLKETGELLIDGVPMRSGRPLIMGMAGKTPIVCVAGHPPEALRGFHLFGTAALNCMAGSTAPMPEDAPPQQS